MKGVPFLYKMVLIYNLYVPSLSLLFTVSSPFPPETPATKAKGDRDAERQNPVGMAASRPVASRDIKTTRNGVDCSQS